jgi:hypothetical protein
VAFKETGIHGQVLAQLARVVFAVALLAVWQAALLHPLQHVDEYGGFVHRAGADGRDARGENDGQNGPLNPSDRLGDVFAALAVCAPDAPAALAQFIWDQEPPLHRFGEPRASSPPPFFAQGPPALI